MESDVQVPVMKETNSIKLSKGQKNTYAGEIKLSGDDETDILKRIKIVNDELVKTYTELNATEEINNGRTKN